MKSKPAAKPKVYRIPVDSPADVEVVVRGSKVEIKVIQRPEPKELSAEQPVPAHQ